MVLRPDFRTRGILAKGLAIDRDSDARLPLATSDSSDQLHALSHAVLLCVLAL